MCRVSLSTRSSRTTDMPVGLGRCGSEWQRLLAPRRATGWQHLQAPAAVLVKPEQDPDQLPARQVFESVLEVPSRQQFDACGGAARSRGLPGRLDLGFERTANVADGVQAEPMRTLCYSRRTVFGRSVVIVVHDAIIAYCGQVCRYFSRMSRSDVGLRPVMRST